jgi:diacylglycerol kinase (ATP)
MLDLGQQRVVAAVHITREKVILLNRRIEWSEEQVRICLSTVMPADIPLVTGRQNPIVAEIVLREERVAVSARKEKKQMRTQPYVAILETWPSPRDPPGMEIGKVFPVRQVCGVAVRHRSDLRVDRGGRVGQHDQPVSHLQDILDGLPARVFVNPLAGGGRAGRHLLRVRRAFEVEKVPAEFVLTASATDLESRAREAIAEGCRFLLAMGGDGTLQGLANGAYGSGVLLGVLPAGGGNDFAAALGLPKDPVAAVHATLNGQPREVDLLRARTSDGCERLYVGGGGVGLDVDASVYAAGIYRRLPGRLRYVASAVRAWLEFTQLTVQAEFPGSEEAEAATMQESVLLAGVLNAPTYGAGLRVAPDARVDDGWLNLSLVKSLGTREVLGLLPRLLIGGNLPRAYLKQKQAQKVLLRTDRPCFFHGDGEILGPAPVEIEVVPCAVKMLAPRAR